MPRLLTVSQAASRLGVHYQTLRVWADTGRLPCVRVGGKRRFDLADVEALAEARERGYAAVGVEAFADRQGDLGAALDGVRTRC